MARPVSSASDRDIIAARATPAGAGAVAIVRLSGPGTRDLVAKVFRPASSKITFARAEAGRLVLGNLHNPGSGERIDECFGVLFDAPKSFTGEDAAELQLHGSPVVVERALHACTEAGARLARPGEFTRRALTNGRLDLAQAEAVCDLIASRTEAANRAALAQLRGGLSERITAARERLVPVIAELEAFVDFPEEGLAFETRERLGREVDSVGAKLEELLESARRGRWVREGARVVLAGPPNAGKSSLFNLLLRRERALVTPHPGTTRDTIEADVDLLGVPLTLVDTAGLRGDAEEIEAMGIERTRQEVRAADLALFVIDSTDPEPAVREQVVLGGSPHLLVFNKTDLLPATAELPIDRFRDSGRRGVLRLSAETRAGADELERALADFFGGAATQETGALVTSRRHADALRTAVKSLQTVAEGLASELSPEFIVVDLTECVAALDSITGRRELDEEVLDEIFSRFCLGK